MAITLTSGFSQKAALPLDDRTVVADLTARDALDPSVRYDGLTVYVLSESTSYQLQGSTGNGSWIAIWVGGGSDNNIDGGVANSVYLPSQIIDGGAANG